MTYLLPDGAAGYVGAPDAEVRAAYEEVWRVVELLGSLVGHPTGGMLLSEDRSHLR